MTNLYHLNVLLNDVQKAPARVLTDKKSVCCAFVLRTIITI